MQILTASEARKSFFNLIRSKKMVEVQHREGNVVILPKEELMRLEKQLIDLQMEKIENSDQKIFSGKDVEAMLRTTL